MSSDLTFITNEKGKNLKERFEVLIKDTKFFDCLVGYFYTSGFYAIYKSLEKTEKIRILIGINTDRQIVESIQQVRDLEQQTLQFSHAEVNEQFPQEIISEMENSENNIKVEEGVNKFKEWLRSGKLEIKAYPSQKIHAKLYIMTFADKGNSAGRVIVGSSNFTQAGLVDNLEFNVELRSKTDHQFALDKFNELWENAVDVKDKYLETIETKTWLNNAITPYQLYLKFLYEYFKDEIKQTEDVFLKYIPSEFKKLEYQKQAVLNARKILEEYGGVFISDVVGLGKTYVSAILASQLDGRTLVIASPTLLEKNNPGSWPNVFDDFRVHAHFESRGKLDHLLKQGVEKYKNVIIDEAHHFRTETNATFEKLAQICRGKRVILVTATPFNNSPKDILSQIKLFQKVRKSTIPGLPNLELFFNKLQNRIKKLDRQKNREEYINIAKDNAKEIREKVLKHLMVRRTRTEIEKYFDKDIKEQNLKFPEVADPQPVFYELDSQEDKIFNKTIELVAQKLTYARYKPMLYHIEKIDQPTRISQENMGRFMKILLIKRLESSFYAFRQSVDRFIAYYEKFLKEFEKGNVYVSKKYTDKIFELLDSDDEEKIQKLIEEEKAEKVSSKEFKKEFKVHLEQDLNALREIKELWNNVNRDPKLLKFIDILSSNKILKESKLIVFTESKETVEYLAKNLEKKFSNQILLFTGSSGAPTRDKVIDNFDAKVKPPKDDYRILVSTEVLAEGVNLHRSNVVINYDIPWNPTRLMQRVGRINRVDTKFDKIYSFNFFPTQQANTQIKLKEAAEAKINAFLTLLGGDSSLLTEGEPVGSHELFDRLISKKTITGEDEAEGGESELKYLNIIKDIRDNDPDLFAQIKQLPKKARTARTNKEKMDSLLTYFRKGKLQKFFLATTKKEEVEELDFISTAQLLESEKDIKREILGGGFYELLEKNKQAFEFITTEEMPEIKMRGGRDSATQILQILKAINKDTRQFVDDQEFYLRKVIRQLEEGGLPKQTTRVVLQELDKEYKENGLNSLKLLAVVQKNVPAKLLEAHFSESAAQTFGPREVILSEYFTNN